MNNEMFAKFNEMFDAKQLKEDVENASHPVERVEIPFGDYEVAISKLELGENEYEDSPSYGCPQVTVCFKIVTGQYKGQRLFWSTNIFGQYAHLSIKNINEFLESLDSGIDIRFEDFKQYAEMLKAIFDEISERYEYQLAFGEGTSKKGSKFKTYNIVQKFDKA